MMTSREFCYWLQGFFEIAQKPLKPEPTGGLTGQQADTIRKHLALVFKHEIDPSYGDATRQAELNEIHSGKNAPVRELTSEEQSRVDAILAESEGLRERVKNLEDHPRHVPEPLIRC